MVHLDVGKGYLDDEAVSTCTTESTFLCRSLAKTLRFPKPYSLKLPATFVLQCMCVCGEIRLLEINISPPRISSWLDM